MRHRGGLLRRWELGLGVVLVLATVAWVWPIAQRITWRTRRAEVPWLLGELKWAQHDWLKDHAAPFPFGPVPRPASAVGADRVPWSELPEGWTPPTRSARGSYRLELADDGTPRLVGTCDVDGDGTRAVYAVGLGWTDEVVRLTPDDVF